MTKDQKADALKDLKVKLEEYPFFYLTDPSAMPVSATNKLRRKCHEAGVEMQVVKNTLLAKVMRDAPAAKGYAGLMDSLHGATAVLYCKNQKLPAKLLEAFYKESNGEKPGFKAAYIDSAVFTGEGALDILKKLKSREELVGEVIGLLQSPAKNVISALLSGGSTIAGLLKTLEERPAESAAAVTPAE
jgi:large subunit ribosomal protein L10